MAPVKKAYSCKAAAAARVKACEAALAAQCAAQQQQTPQKQNKRSASASRTSRRLQDIALAAAKIELNSKVAAKPKRSFWSHASVITPAPPAKQVSEWLGKLEECDFVRIGNLTPSVESGARSSEPPQDGIAAGPSDLGYFDPNLLDEPADVTGATISAASKLRNERRKTLLATKRAERAKLKELLESMPADGGPPPLPCKKQAKRGAKRRTS